MSIPSHIAIILDGNRRWAKQRNGSSSLVGHEAGYQTLKRLIKHIADERPSIMTLTVFAFSTENWKRSKEEVDGIMNLAATLLSSDLSSIVSYGARIRVLGDRKRLPETVRNSIKAAEEQTSNNTKFLFVVALNYGGSWDIVEGFNRLYRMMRIRTSQTNTSSDFTRQEVSPDQDSTETPNGSCVNPTCFHGNCLCEALEDDVDDMVQLDSIPSKIDENLALSFLPSGFLPPVDLLIRTGGEKRISNFLPWQLAYAELYFTDVLWPDFTPAHLNEALQFYCTRQRRFGGDNNPSIL